MREVKVTNGSVELTIQVEDDDTELPGGFVEVESKAKQPANKARTAKNKA